MDSEEIKGLQKRTADGIKMLTLIREGERVDWVRRSPVLKRDITVYIDLLDEAQKQRLNEIEQELLGMAYEGEEETTVKKILKSPKKKAGNE